MRLNDQTSRTEMRNVVIGKEIGHVAEVPTTQKHGGVVSGLGNGGAGPITSSTEATEGPLGEWEAHGKRMVGDYVILSR